MSSKKRRVDYESDDGFVEDGAPSSKKSKSNRPGASSKAKRVDENGDPFWEISTSGTRRVTVNEFRGKYMVNIREYYEKDGKKLPGKKGISLPLDQYSLLIQSIPSIEAVLKAKGQKVPRPSYDRAKEPEVDIVDSDVDEEIPDNNSDSADKAGKANYEATSEEDD